MVRNKNLLKGIKINVTVSDPWEFVTEFGSGPFKFKILEVDKNFKKALIQFVPPLKSDSKRLTYFVVQVRHENESISNLVKNKSIACNLTGIPSDRLDLKKPFDLSWWRGGLVLLGTLSI